MLDFKVGDRVRLSTKNPSYGWGALDSLKRNIGIVREVCSDVHGDCKKVYVDFPEQIYWTARSSELELEETPAIPAIPVAPKKPRAPKRQFDKQFKVTVVRAVKAIRSEYPKGSHCQGKVAEYLRTLQVTTKHFNYWNKQFDLGHFSDERAIAFSRKPTMIHG